MEVSAVDLLAALAQPGPDGVRWSSVSEQLNVNLVRFGPGQGVAEHINAEVDVLIVVIAGEGVALVDGAELPLRPGRALVIPRGARRATRCAAEALAYVTCHVRRGGLMPR